MAHTMPKWNLLIWNEQPATSGWHPECDTSLDLSWCATFLMQGAILDDVVLKDLRHDRKGRLLRPLLLTDAVNLWHLLSSILSLQRLWDVSSSKIYINIYNIKINIIHIIYIYVYWSYITSDSFPPDPPSVTIPLFCSILSLHIGALSRPSEQTKGFITSRQLEPSPRWNRFLPYRASASGNIQQLLFQTDFANGFPPSILLPSPSRLFLHISSVQNLPSNTPRPCCCTNLPDFGWPWLHLLDLANDKRRIWTSTTSPYQHFPSVGAMGQVTLSRVGNAGAHRVVSTVSPVFFHPRFTDVHFGNGNTWVDKWKHIVQFKFVPMHSKLPYTDQGLWPREPHWSANWLKNNKLW